MSINPLTITGPNTVTSDLLRTIHANVTSHLRKKLESIKLETADLELHNSSATSTCRAYVTLRRPASLKALQVAEQILVDEIGREFSFHLHAVYWRYAPDPSAADA